MKQLCSTLLVLTLTISCQDLEKTNDINNIFLEWNNDDTPGGAIGIVKEGNMVFSRGYGVANLEHGIPITSSTVFYIGSTGKQFTSFCLLLMEEQGEIDLDAEIQTYLPDFPRYSSPITVRHLAYHTSGIRDYSSIWYLQGTSYYEHMTADETYELIKKQSALNFKPGEEYSYSNSGYFLMAEIVEKQSGKSLKEFAQENIFEPLGMYNTTYLDDNRDLIRNRAFGYDKKLNGEGFNNLIRRFELVGSGGVYSTVEDLYLWDQNFYDNQLGTKGQKLINKMQEEGSLIDGSLTGRSFGLVNSTYNGLKTISHSGSHGGFKAQLLRSPEQDFSTIVLANRSDTDMQSKSYSIADLFLKDIYQNVDTNKLALSDTQSINISPEKMDALTGHYLDIKNGNVRKVINRNGTLYYYRRESSQDRLEAIKEYELKMVDQERPTELKFRTVNGNMVMSYYSDKIHRADMHRFDLDVYTESELEQFEGKYYGADIDRTYELKVHNHQLKIYIDGKQLSEVSSLSSDVFHDSSLGVLFFDRDIKNQVVRFKLNSPRVRGLIFEKVQTK